MFKAIGTGGRGFRRRQRLAMPQKLLCTGMSHFSIMWQGPLTMADEAFPGGHELNFLSIGRSQSPEMYFFKHEAVMVNTTACDFLKVSENKIEKIVSKTCFGLKSGHICYRFLKEAELTHFAFFVLFCSTVVEAGHICTCMIALFQQWVICKQR